MTRPTGDSPSHGGDVNYVILIAATAALGGLLFGFDTSIINGAVGAIQKAFDATSWEIGLAVSSALIGSAIGALAAGQIADRFGRTRTMLVASGLFFLGSLGSGIAFGINDFVFWRVIGGLAVGAASVIAPAYIAEVAPAQIRGRLGSLQQLAIVVGIFIALLHHLGGGRVRRKCLSLWHSGLALDVLD
jgi:SP family sugar:H+ symporter-like MFS transporter